MTLSRTEQRRVEGAVASGGVEAFDTIFNSPAEAVVTVARTPAGRG